MITNPFTRSRPAKMPLIRKEDEVSPLILLSHPEAQVLYQTARDMKVDGVLARMDLRMSMQFDYLRFDSWAIQFTITSHDVYNESSNEIPVTLFRSLPSKDLAQLTPERARWWIKEQILYVMQHESLEGLQLMDGTIPFNPHVDYILPQSSLLPTYTATIVLPPEQPKEM